MNQRRQPQFTEPVLRLGIADLQVLRGIVQAYLGLVRRIEQPSRKRDEEIAHLQAVYHRLKGIPTNTLEIHLTLFKPEVTAINNALLGFSAFVRKKVAPSRDRDECLQDIEHFRQILLSTFG